MNIATTLRTEKPQPVLSMENAQPDLLTEAIQSKLGNPERSSDIDLHAATNQVLKDVRMSTADSGGKVTFYGRDPIIPSPFRFGSMAAIGLAAKAVAVAALWRHRTGEGQDIAVDVRKARGASPASSTGNGKQSMDVPPLVGTPRTRSNICRCFGRRRTGGTS